VGGRNGGDAEIRFTELEAIDFERSVCEKTIKREKMNDGIAH
jgi:hypothetical protein